MNDQARILFWDVDTQVDFMHPDGELYVPGAENLYFNLERLSRAAERNRFPIVASADAHTIDDVEISDDPDFRSTFPPHCMRDTPGAERITQTAQDWTLVFGPEPRQRDEIRSALAGRSPRVLIQKQVLDVFSNPNTEVVLQLIGPEHVVLYGVATDFCNRAAIEGLLARDVAVTIVTDAIEAIETGRAKTLLAEWQDRGVSLRTTDEVLAEL